MPDGVVQWFDPDRGEGRVLHRRRRFAVTASDVEPAARVPGARVHFDVDHDSDGTRATNVTLRRGTRSVKRQRRFGDLAGAPTATAKKPPTLSRDELDLDPELFRNPTRVAERWAERLADGDLDDVLLLYSPTASLHTGGRVLVGLPEIRRHWERSPLLGGPLPAGVRGGGDDTILVRWPAQAGQEAATETRLRVFRGEITEQWLGPVETVEESGEAAPLTVELSVDGEVTQHHRDRVMDRIGKVVAKTDQPVLHARVRLVNVPDAGRDRPAVAKVMLDVDGEPIRASVASDDLDAAVDALEDRLRHQLERLRAHREAARRPSGGSPGEWRRGDRPTPRPSHHPRPVEQRQVVRHKTFGPVETTVEEALFDLEAMDYDFFLFTDLATGQDAFVHRRDEGGYGLQVQDGQVEDTLAGAPEMEVHPDPDPAPRLSLQQARERLDLGPEPWVFFTDADSDRGHVLYRRYDGHYGLITPR